MKNIKLLTASVLSLALLGGSLGTAEAATTSTVQASAAVSADTVISKALSYIGKVKYVYGVRDPQHLTFDCSAFTQFIFAKYGIDIPWGSNAQAKIGKAITSKSQLHKGDLVMFSVGTPGQINHVGIYIGNGQFVHNHPVHGVEIASLTSGYWQNRFIIGRHVL